MYMYMYNVKSYLHVHVHSYLYSSFVDHGNYIVIVNTLLSIGSG